MAKHIRDQANTTRPDFSNYVAHFTSARDPLGRKKNKGDCTYANIQGSAYDKLVSILRQKVILATHMPWTNAKAVAFTECPWWSLLSHAKRYSPYGVGFTKSRLLAAGGAPAIYIRPHLYKAQKQKNLCTGIEALMTPFVPQDTPEEYLEKHWKNKKPVDFSHEREWRVDRDFKFEYKHIGFVILDTYEDMAKLPQDIKDAIGREKFLLMDIYRQIERLWPTHLL